MYGDGELDIWYPWSETTGASLLTCAKFTVVGVSSWPLSSNLLRYRHNISPTNMKYRTPFWHWRLPTCQGPTLKKIRTSKVLSTSCRNIQLWPFRKRWSWTTPPPPGMCVLNKTHVDLSPMANHVHSTSTEGFLYPRTNYPHKKQWEWGKIVICGTDATCLHPQRWSTCIWLCLWHKQIYLHENKGQKNVKYCSNKQRSCMWERSWQKTVCWLHLSLRLLRKSSRFLLIIHVQINAS